MNPMFFIVFFVFVTFQSNAATYCLTENACAFQLFTPQPRVVVVMDASIFDGSISFDSNLTVTSINNGLFSVCEESSALNLPACPDSVRRFFTEQSCGDFPCIPELDCRPTEVVVCPSTPACHGCTYEGPDIFGSCGDWSLQPQSEQCDDGNNVDGDGCDRNCQIEAPDFLDTVE